LAKLSLKFSQIFPQLGWLVEKGALEYLLTLSIISLTFIHAKWIKFMPTFVKPLAMGQSH
jgi:hypothetical protein